MPPPIRALPILEKWDCHGCGVCCRGSTILLDDKDLARLREQEWEKRPEFRDVKTVGRERLLGGKYVLAKQADGSCVFLTGDGRCRIHELYGAEAKPAVCRIFPLQLVPLGDFAYLTPRRSCPSAAADRGRAVAEHVRPFITSALVDRFQTEKTAPPDVVRGVRRGWREFLAAADELERLMTDQRYPVVRRVVHGLGFCALMERCKLRRVKEQEWRELMQVLAASANEQASQFFHERRPPSWATASLFRQAAVHYIRSHPGFRTTGGWRERWRLVWISLKFARGKGVVPPLHAEFPASTFEQLNLPLGPLPDEVAQPLNRYFETHATSKQYAVVGTRRSLVESFRVLAFLYPVALWMLRMASGDRAPTAEDMINIVAALERGQGLAPLSHGTTAMAGTEQLQRLIAWYAR